MAGVTTLNFSSLQVTTLAPGATKVASVLPGGDPLIASRPVSGGHTTVGITAYLGSSNFSGDWARLIVNAGRWLSAFNTHFLQLLRHCSRYVTATPTAQPQHLPSCSDCNADHDSPATAGNAGASATATPRLLPPRRRPQFAPANISTRMRVGQRQRSDYPSSSMAPEVAHYNYGIGPAATFGVPSKYRIRCWTVRRRASSPPTTTGGKFKCRRGHQQRSGAIELNEWSSCSRSRPAVTLVLRGKVARPVSGWWKFDLERWRRESG